MVHNTPVLQSVFLQLPSALRQSNDLCVHARTLTHVVRSIVYKLRSVSNCGTYCLFLLGMYNHMYESLEKNRGDTFFTIYVVQNYIIIHNSQFIWSISCISSYMFRLIYGAIFRLVFGVVCTYSCWCFESYLPEDGSVYEPKHVARNTANTSNKLRVLYD